MEQSKKKLKVTSALVRDPRFLLVQAFEKEDDFELQFTLLTTRNAYIPHIRSTATWSGAGGFHENLQNREWSNEATLSLHRKTNLDRIFVRLHCWMTNEHHGGFI